MSELSTSNKDGFFFCESIKDVCEQDLHSDTVSSSLDSPTESGLLPKTSRQKKVRFMDSPKLVTVHVIEEWDNASRQARVSPWEVIARDSRRFKLRILSLEPILSAVFNPEHRAKVWERMNNI